MNTETRDEHAASAPPIASTDGIQATSYAVSEDRAGVAPDWRSIKVYHVYILNSDDSILEYRPFTNEEYMARWIRSFGFAYPEASVVASERMQPTVVRGNILSAVAYFSQNAQGDLIDILFYCFRCAEALDERATEHSVWPSYSFGTDSNTYCSNCGHLIHTIAGVEDGLGEGIGRCAVGHESQQ